MFVYPVTRRASHHFSRHPASLLNAALQEGLAPWLVAEACTADAAPRTPAIDVAETTTAYTVTVDLPGVAKEDVKVSIDGRRVEISAAPKAAASAGTAATTASATPATNEASDAAAERPSMILRERTQGAWARQFTLAEELDQAVSSAKLELGVLTLVLAKKRQPGASQLTIN